MAQKLNYLNKQLKKNFNLFFIKNSFSFYYPLNYSLFSSFNSFYFSSSSSSSLSSSYSFPSSSSSSSSLKRNFSFRTFSTISSSSNSSNSSTSSSSSSLTSPSESAMIHSTNLWIHKVVIKLTLCPWAAKDVQNTQIRVFFEKEVDPNHLLAYKQTKTDIFNFAKDLAFDLPHVHSGMAIVPQFKDFEEFLLFADDFVDILKTTGLEAYIQIATFHPDYIFEDTEEDSPENWTRKSY